MYFPGVKLERAAQQPWRFPEIPDIWPCGCGSDNIVPFVQISVFQYDIRRTDQDFMMFDGSL